MDDNMRSAFSIDKVKLKRGNLKVVQSRAAMDAQQRRKTQFVKVPMEWIDRLDRARHTSTFKVAFELLHRRWKGGDKPVLLPNAGLAGVSRIEEWRALAELELLGLIAIERRRRKAPLITILD